MKIGKPVFKAMARRATPDYISSDCPLAGAPHRAGHRRSDGAAARPQLRIRSRLLRIAYGLE